MSVWLALLVCLPGFGALAQQLASVDKPLTKGEAAQDQDQNSLRGFLNKFGTQYAIKFAFDSKLVEDKMVNLPDDVFTPEKYSSHEIEKTLDKVLQPFDLKYVKVYENYYVIQQNEEKPGKKVLKLTKKSPSLSLSGAAVSHPPVKLSGEGIGQSQIAFLDKTISGTVTDENDEGLPGVNILAKGTTMGTVTDVDGNYRLTVGDEITVLVFSSVGYVTGEIPVENQSIINVQMVPDIQSLSEIVVTGYSTQQKKDITGSVAVVETDALKAIPTGSGAQALQGQAAGVTVVSSGAPGGRNDIFIRGVTSFGNTQPLILVDGVPIQGGLNDININDIASMQILKDAGAAAIYGVRGSNGVIVVTTKKGKSGKPTISYDGYYGVQIPPKNNVFNLLGSQDFATIVKSVTLGTELFANGVPEYTYAGPGVSGTAMAGDPAIDPAKYNFDPQNPANDYMIQQLNQSGTDWFDEIFENAPLQNHNLTASGGTDNANYLVSLGFFDQQGTLIETYLKRYSARINTEFKPNKNIRFGENVYLFYKQNPGFNNQSEGNAIGHSYRIMPVIPVHDIQGNYGGTWLGPEFGEGENSVALQKDTRNDRNNFWNIQGNVFAEADFLEHFTARTSFGGSVENQYYFQFRPNRYHSKQDHNSENTFNENALYNTSYTWTNTLSYNNVFGKHTVTLLAGTEAYKRSGRGVGGSANNYFSTDPDYLILNNGTTSITNYSNSYVNTLFSLFARLDYSYADKYLVGATIRRDGSSVFGSEKRYGAFPSFSLGWRISEEGFMNNLTFLDDLKLRASYGILGSQANVSPSNAFSLYGSSFGNSYYDITGSNTSTQQGFRQSRIGNPSTGWEEDVITNLGFDATLLDYKLDLSFEVYKKSINGLLFPLPLPSTTGGATAPTVNIGDIQNKGWEFSVAYSESRNNDFRYSVSANIGSYKNEVVRIPDPGYFDVVGSRIGTLVRNQEGNPVGSFYGYEVVGLFQDDEAVSASPPQTDAAPGRFKYRDVDGDNEITPDDRTFFGDPNPDFTYGLNISLNYKNFDFSTIFYGSQGNDVINFVKYYTHFMGTSVGRAKSNVLKEAWTPENPDASVPVVESASSFSTNGVFNSYYMEDGSFFKLRSLLLGYTVNPAALSKFGVSKFRVYLQAANLFTITKYSGIDPELSGNLGGNQASAAFGIDFGNYPNNQQSFLLGINLTF